MAEKLAPEKRHDFIHNGQKVFEWDQTLEEVNLYITLPPNVHPKAFHCKIESKHLEVGIKGNPPYLNHDLSAPVKTDCSFWTLEDDIMHITLQKREKGQTWASPILGQGQLDPYATDLEQKRLMLQRFQEENPGFDFSQAQFTGRPFWDNQKLISFYGRKLKGKKLSEMETTFLELKLHTPNEIHDLLKSSYETLNDNEKNIFLDIACFSSMEKMLTM